MNPYVIAAGVLTWAASVGGSFLYGQRVGAEHEIAITTRIDQTIRDTRTAAQQGAADAIAALKPVSKTIVQRTQREVATNTVYADCRVPIDGVRLANEAIIGRRAEPAGDQQLPRADPTVR